MTTRACIQCGRDFVVRKNKAQKLCSIACNLDRQKAQARERAKLRCDLPRSKCRRCGGPLILDRHSGGLRYCSDACRYNTAESIPGGRPCQNCGRLFVQTGTLPKMYCGAVCRKAAHFARHADDAGAGLEEIAVVDIDEAPKRLAVAKLFDRFDGAGNFDHYTPVQWVNPSDKRASR